MLIYDFVVYCLGSLRDLWQQIPFDFWNGKHNYTFKTFIFIEFSGGLVFTWLYKQWRKGS